MALIKTGHGIIDIRGGYGGVYFTRDKSGLHIAAKPRRVQQRTAAQDIQRNAFIKARKYTTDPRWVSYYIYRALNNLPFIFDAHVTGTMTPDCTGKYEPAGTFNDKDYYTLDENWFIWWNIPHNRWVITPDLDISPLGNWEREHPNISGLYLPKSTYTGNPTVSLQLQPPPTDFQIPNL